MFRPILAALAVAVTVSACAETPPSPVAQVDDTSLTCSAIAKEREANERQLRVTNDPYLASTNFTRSTPFLDAQTKAPALNKRQADLEKLAAKRGC